MLRESFHRNWKFGKEAGERLPGQQGGQEGFLAVDLPFDAMVSEKRDPNCKNSNATGFYPGGIYQYVKRFYVPAEQEQKNSWLEFEGVYQNAQVFVNGSYAGGCKYGYTNFYVRLDSLLKYGAENEILVKVNNSAEPNARWYTGSGIYRNVNLMIGNAIHIVPDGVRITTLEATAEYVWAEAAITIENNGSSKVTAQLKTEILTENGEPAAFAVTTYTTVSGTKETVYQKLLIKNPQLWNLENPKLYQVKVSLEANNEILDTAIETTGFRVLLLDPIKGLRINGKEVKLRGACIHHDSGILGAATFKDGEFRRIRRLKEAGFNAIRSAHQPVSKETLLACDTYGMVVMEEAFDMWNNGKSAFDYALDFPLCWKDDITAMIQKDYNHPAVVFYSIGNEIPEMGTKEGAAISRELACYIKELDATRFTTCGLNGAFCVFDYMEEIIQDIKGPSAVTSQAGGDINEFMTLLNGKMDEIVTHKRVSQVTEEAFAAVDLAGYNYMTGRYAKDKELYPNRVICGTETYPPEIDRNWALVKAHAHVIGDFTWCGWDYIGEAGVGVHKYDGFGFFAPYPCFLAYVGDLDIIGSRRPMSYYREIVWGLRQEPYIAVHKVDKYNKPAMHGPWSGNDCISSWTWRGMEGQPTTVEVYAAAEEVELFLNGVSLGRKPAGEGVRFITSFETSYQPGELLAVAYQAGQETGRMVLATAKEQIKLVPITEPGEELTYINIEVQDDKGRLNCQSDIKIAISIEGPGTLKGLGSANPFSTENFFADSCTTFEGKALAVVRGHQSGATKVTIAAPDETVTLTL